MSNGKGSRNRTSNYKQYRENFDKWQKNEETKNSKVMTCEQVEEWLKYLKIIWFDNKDIPEERIPELKDFIINMLPDIKEWKYGDNMIEEAYDDWYFK